MEQYTLIGHPLGHSMSPFIHERLFAMAGREASYTLTDIAPEHLEGKEPYLRSLQGFNITIPHKMAIIPIVDELDESAKRYNSVNCVANQNGKLIGYNTDCDGFTMSVKEYPMIIRLYPTFCLHGREREKIKELEKIESVLKMCR